MAKKRKINSSCPGCKRKDRMKTMSYAEALVELAKIVVNPFELLKSLRKIKLSSDPMDTPISFRQEGRLEKCACGALSTVCPLCENRQAVHSGLGDLMECTFCGREYMVGF